MADVAQRIYLDNEAASESQLDLFDEIRVDQGIGMATEAELEMRIGLDDSGYWSGIEEEFTQPQSRVRVEVKVADEFVPLIDGPIVGQSLELSSGPNESKLVLVVQDDSVLLNQSEEVALFEDLTADEIARQLFEAQGLEAEVDAVPGVAGGLPRIVVQRGTAMQLLRELGRRHGMFVYVEPAAEPGHSTGVFKLPDLSESELPEILIMGGTRNVDRFSVRFDGLRPMTVRADGVRITDQEVLSKTISASGLTPLGDTPVHDTLTPGELLLARTREEESDLEEAATAAVDHSSWAYSATGELVTGPYGAVLRPHRVVRVAGAGGFLGGSYLISRVAHTLSSEGYRQQFTLRRNARSAGSGDAGGVPGGIF